MTLQMQTETPRRCFHCHPVHVGTPTSFVQHHVPQYYTPNHCGGVHQNGTYTPHRGSFHGGEFIISITISYEFIFLTTYYYKLFSAVTRFMALSMYL